MAREHWWSSAGLVGVVAMAVAQPAQAQVAQITGVLLNPRTEGLEVLLQTTAAASTLVQTSQSSSQWIADISNAQLALPDGAAFRQDNPTAQIALVTVQNLDNRVQIVVTGNQSAPTGQVFLRQGQGLVATIETPVGEQPPSTPASEASQELAPIELVVTAEREVEGYQVEQATTATRTSTPLRDIPQSIQVVPRQVLEEQQVTRLGDAVRNVSGVTVLQGYGGSTDNYTIRGLAASSNLRNGFRDDGFLSFSDPSNIERIEVLKGPASVLYGQFEPGGVVNYVTKKPLSDPFYEGQLKVGSYDFYRSSLDLSGPLTPDQSLLYRLNLAYENAGSFRDFVGSELFVAAPVLTYNLSDATTLTLEYEYANLDRTFDRGFPPEPEVFSLPISRFLGEPEDRYGLTAHKPSLAIEHQFNENLRLRSAFSAQTFSAERANAQARTFRLEPDRRTLRRRYTVSEEQVEDYGLQTDLISTFNTGSLAHELLVGFELGRGSSDSLLRRAEFAPIDILAPVYGSPVPTTLAPVFDTVRRSDTLGIYLQDQVDVQPNLKLLLGGRFDFVDFETTDRLAETTTSRGYGVFSPRVGIVYQPIEPLSLYASYSRSFRPNIFALTSGGELLEPERGTQYEVGVKGAFLDGRLSATLAAYSLTKTNVATADPNDLDFSIAAGKIKSRGIELDVVGQLIPGWNIIASYAYNDAFVSEDNTLPQGDRLINAPQHSASLWTTYEIQQGDLQGFGFGAGVFFAGDREAELPNTITIPSFVRADATLFYRRDNWKAALNFKNLFGTRYYESQGFLIYPGAPLTVVGSLSVQF